MSCVLGTFVCDALGATLNITQADDATGNAGGTIQFNGMPEIPLQGCQYCANGTGVAAVTLRFFGASDVPGGGPQVQVGGAGIGNFEIGNDGFNIAGGTSTFDAPAATTFSGFFAKMQ